jgi:HEAT repeat protein
MPSLLKELSGRDLRSIGRSNEVVAHVVRNPSLFNELFQGLTSSDRVVRMRAADAIEKITRARPELLRPRKRKLLALAARAKDKEFRWHMALMLPRLHLSATERTAAVDILYEYLRDSSRIVRTWAIEGLVDFAREDQKLMPRVLPLVREFTENGTPAMRARGRKILKQLRSG